MCFYSSMLILLLPCFIIVANQIAHFRHYYYFYTFSADDSNHKTDKANKSSPSPVLSQSLTFPPPSGSKISREAWKEVAILSSVATMIMYAETMLIPAIP